MAVSERFQGANMIDAGRRSPYWGEHAARYVRSSPLVANTSVLDIACGTGYGIGILGKSASYVIGVDVDAEAASEAKAECVGNSAVLLGNGLGLPFADETFDVVTSFETLEHLHDRDMFLAELHRVLKEAGMLLLSTPNANYTQPLNGRPSNPFHIHEYMPDALHAELSKRFHVDEFLGQTLDPSAGIPPFYEAQQRLPGDLSTRVRLAGWRGFNKIPFALREWLSERIWSTPFYPREVDYNFGESTVSTAPTIFAVCRKK